MAKAAKNKAVVDDKARGKAGANATIEKVLAAAERVAASAERAATERAAEGITTCPIEQVR